ncbi:MAG: nicotinate (nicotinamide) nucleotide adenylyltransferase [Rikenellaceae bacterium]|nr:nicotinate (nicotinamide) nucleotide adenylyltransferase [Rikenellaceae bacterium]
MCSRLYTGRTALYFGSFNPPHNGHLAIGRHAVEGGYADSVVYVVSPQSPFKSREELAPEADRLAMLSVALEECGMTGFASVSDIEFAMPRPSYTFDTVRRLKEYNPDAEFVLMMGADNVAGFGRWYRAGELRSLLSDILVYPRRGYGGPLPSWCRPMNGAPLFDVSSTELRARLLSHDGVARLLPRSVENYIMEKGLYAAHL